MPNETLSPEKTMNELASERNNRCKRGQQASSNGCRTDARLTGVSCQRGKTRPCNLNSPKLFGSDRSRADCLWCHRIGRVALYYRGLTPFLTDLRPSELIYGIVTVNLRSHAVS